MHLSFWGKGFVMRSAISLGQLAETKSGVIGNRVCEVKPLKESNYIRYRKLKAFGNRCCFWLCRVFPIKRNLISVCTFEGKGGFGCNPKYLVQELHKIHSEYEFVWFVNKSSWEKEFPEYIRKVPNTLWSRAYWLTRSKVWIDNYRKPYGTCKRRGQYYLNVNHMVFPTPVGPTKNITLGFSSTAVISLDFPNFKIIL